MKRTLAVLLAFLLTANASSAVFAEEGIAEEITAGQKGLLAEEAEVLLSDSITEDDGGIAVENPDDSGDREESEISVSDYAGLKEALEVSYEAETVIRLTADISGFDQTITVPDGARVILDLSGYSLTAAETFTGEHCWMILNNGTLVITGEGTIDVGTADEEQRICLISTGNLTIEDGTFRGAMPVFCDSGTVTVTGGIFEGTSDAPTFGICGGSVVIEGEPVFNGNIMFSIHNAYEVPPSLTIEGGTYTASSGLWDIPEDASYEISVGGGSFEVTDSDYETVLAEIEGYVAGGATVTVMGEEYTAEVPEPEPAPEGEKLDGDIYGSDAWDDNEDTTFDKAFDGDISTFYDAYAATIEAHVSMDVGAPTHLTEVHIVPRNANGYDPEITMVDGTEGFENEGAGNLFDRTLDAKLCAPGSTHSVKWETDRPAAVYGYQMYTANDNSENPGRNPITWKLYGSNDPENDGWEIIDEQSNNYEIPDGDCEVYEVLLGEETTGENGEPEFIPAPSAEYRYFRLDIEAVEGGFEETPDGEPVYIFQLSEFRLLESENEYMRMAGMTVQGSSDGELWADIYTFPNDHYFVQEYVVNADDMPLADSYSFTRFRVINRKQHFNVAEVEFYGTDGSGMMEYPTMVDGEHNLLETGEPYGSDAWDENSTFDKAFDGNPETYYDAAENVEQEIGIVLGTPAQLTRFVVHPRGDGNEYRMCNLTVQGSVNGDEWITLYRFDDVRDYGFEYYEVTSDMFASAAHEYAFTQFRVVNPGNHLNAAEVEFYGTYNYDESVEVFPIEFEEPIYSYLTAEQFLDTAWVYYERDPENPDDDHYLDHWYFNETDEEGMTRFEREFEGREPVILLGGVGFNKTVMEIRDIDGKPVVAVVPHVFAEEREIVELIIDENSECKYIMHAAFSGSGCRNVTVSNSLRQVDYDAFNCPIREFIKADRDLSIEEKEARNWGFVEIVDGALISRDDVLVRYPPEAEYVESYRIPDHIHHIANWAFSAADIGEITLGNHILTIGYGAFRGSTAEKIILSPALHFLADDVFSGCTNLTDLVIPSDDVEIERRMDEDTDLTDDEFMFSPWMFDWTNHEERTEPLKVTAYAGSVIEEYIDYVKSLDMSEFNSEYDMSHVEFEAYDGVHWLYGDWFEECEDGEVFIIGLSAPKDAKIGELPQFTEDGRTIIGVRTDGEAWSGLSDSEAIGDENGRLVIPEGYKYIFEAPFRGCENLRTIELPTTLRNVSIPFADCHSLEKFVVAEGSRYFETHDNGATLYGIYIKGDNYHENEYNLEAVALASGMEHVDIPEGTTVIHGAAFEHSKTIKSVTLPGSLLGIDAWAFKDTTLESITIPANVDRILPEAFAYCSNLTEVRIERKSGEFCNSENWHDQDFTTVFEGSDNVTVYVYEGTDAHRAAEEYGWNYVAIDVEETVYEMYTANDGVHLYGVVPATADGEPVTDFVIPEEVMVIDDEAFADLAITSVTFPKNLHYISSRAFAGCGTEFEVRFSGAAMFGWEGDSFDEGFDMATIYNEALFWNQHWDGKFLYYVMPEAKEVMLRGYWYSAIDQTTGEMIIPSVVEIDGENYTVASIEPHSFEDGSADRLGEHVRNNAENFGWEIEDCEWRGPKTIVIPDTVRFIGEDAFAWQYYYDEETGEESGLESVQLPKSVQWIENNAFNGCRMIGEFTNLDAYGDENSENPYRLTEDGSVINVWNEHILYAYPCGKTNTEYTVPTGIEGIGFAAFNGAKNLETVTISEGVRWTDNESFANCSNLTTVYISYTLEDISHGSFRGCNSLMHFCFAGEDAGEHFFIHDDGSVRDGRDNGNLVVFPLGRIPEAGYYEVSDDVTGIYGAAFAGSNRLTEVVLPESLVWISDCAFEGSDNLRTVTFKRGEGEEDRRDIGFHLNVFAWCPSLETVVYEGDLLELWTSENDDDENFISNKFNFVVSNENCEVVGKNFDVDDNMYFTLIRGQQPEGVYGDVNGDGELTIDDALCLLRYTILPDRYPLSEGNHNFDGSEDNEITAADAAALKNYIISNQ